jgi:hypothetical protein
MGRMFVAGMHTLLVGRREQAQHETAKRLKEIQKTQSDSSGEASQ